MFLYVVILFNRNNVTVQIMYTCVLLYTKLLGERMNNKLLHY